MITDCFILRCGDQDNRIAAIEKFKDELCKAGGIIKNVVISDEISDGSTNNNAN